MTKKDYIKLAELIKDNREYLNDWTKNGIGTPFVPFDRLVNGLCAVLAEDNPRFDKARFLSACNYK